MSVRVGTLMTSASRDTTVTQWIDDTGGGRDRGPRAVVRAWFEVLVRPGNFFRVAIAPGDQAPGLVFAMLVVLGSETLRLVLVSDPYPVFSGELGLPPVLGLALVVVLVTPLVLHLVAALQTVLLIVGVRERAGISETVQVYGYAVAPCVFAGVPVPEVRAACAIYGTVLLVIGIAVVHRTSVLWAAVVSAIPAAIVFGYGFRGFAAIETVLRNWYII